MALFLRSIYHNLSGLQAQHKPALLRIDDKFDKVQGVFGTAAPFMSFYPCGGLYRCLYQQQLESLSTKALRLRPFVSYEKI